MLDNSTENLQLNGVSPKKSSIESVLQMVDRINQKQIEISEDIANLRKSILFLHSNNSPSTQQANVVPQQNHVQQLSDNLALNGVQSNVHQQATNGTNLSLQQLDTLTRYSNLASNGTAP